MADSDENEAGSPHSSIDLGRASLGSDDHGLLDQGMCDNEERMEAELTLQEIDWETIPQTLRQPGLMNCHAEIFGDKLMRLPPEMIHTMNGVSKCWRTIDRDCESLLTNETEGGSWAFCEKCVAQIPKRIQEILYFFHRIKSDLTDYKGFAIKSRNVTFAKPPASKDAVSHLIWCRPVERKPAMARAPDEDDDVDMNRVMSERRMGSDGELKTKIDPIKIRLGKTGAFFKVDGREEIMTFSVLVITWARHFDLLGYITQKFLQPPKVDSMRSSHEALQMMWKRMQRFVAFDNLGLDETLLGTPEDYAHQPGGALGVDSLFNLFQIPFQIRGIIRQTVLERLRGRDKRARLKDVKVADIQIVGLPNLSFKSREDKFADYVTYMQRYIDNLVNERAGWEAILRKMNGPKDKENKEAAEAMSCDLKNPGAWPLAWDQERSRYVRFGLPRLPIWLNFTPETMVTTGSQDLWFASLGGADGLPELVKMCLRSFLVRSTDTSSWDLFLLDCRPANCSLVLQEHYGEQSDPLSGIMLAGNLRPWWMCMEKDLSTLRAANGGVQEAMERFSRFLESAVHQLVSSVHAGSYRSARLQQAMSVVDRLDFQQVGHSDASSIESFVAGACEGIPVPVRANQYQRANESFFLAFEVVNKAFSLNSSNLEFLVELMVSQIMWNMGENNETIAAFFQGIHVLSGNGHFKLTLKTGVTHNIPSKPNTTGMDYVLGILITLYQMLLDMAGITEARMNLQAPANVTNWTPHSFQLCCCASVRGNPPVLDSLPEASLLYQSIASTEMRGMDLGSLIKYAFKRFSGHQRQVSFLPGTPMCSCLTGMRQINLNTCDPEKTNQRQSINREKVSDLQFCAMSTNERNPDDERLKTLGVVMHRMVPGSGPHIKRQKTGGFNNATCDSFSGRQNQIRNQDTLVNVLMYTHNFALTLPALLNRSSVVPYEINPCVLGLLDWLSFWIKDHTARVFDPIVYESYKRIREGYEARQVTKALWTTCIMVIPSVPSKEEAVQRIAQIMHCNALPVSEAVPAMHNLLTRVRKFARFAVMLTGTNAGVHIGCLLMMAVMAKHLGVPVISMAQLKRFLALPQVI